MRTTQTGVTTGSGGTEVLQGSIAARIDRLPLTRIQYVLAGITQLFWGLIIDTDGIASRLYPFVWAPMGMSTFQYSLLYAGNTGVGILAGQYLGGPLSDRFGRKRILVVAALLAAVFLFPVAHTNQFGWLLVWHVLYGIGLGLVLATNNVYLQEIAPPDQRHKLSMRAQLVTGICSFLPGILGVLFVPEHYTWFIYVLAIAVLALVPIGAFALPESPRWLEQKGRSAEADAIVSRWESRIERITGRDLPAPQFDRNVVVRTEKVPIREMFGGTYGRRIVLLMVVWSLGYAGIVYGMTGFMPNFLAANDWSADDVFFWMYIVAAALKVASFYLFSYMGERYERKNLVLWLGVAGAATMCLLLLTSSFAVQALVVCLIVPIETLWLFNMYNYTSSAFPTRIRASGYSWTNGFGHTAQIWGPLLVAPLFAATAASGHWGWVLWVALPGAVVPSVMIALWGVRQKGRTVEEIAR